MSKETTKEEALRIADAFGMRQEVEDWMNDGYEPWAALYEWDLPTSIEEYNETKEMM